MSSVRLGFHFCCPLDNYFNPSHFHLDNNEAQAWRNCRSAGPDRQISIWSGRFNKNVGPGDRQNVK
ncbi:hypothetical protein DPMN_077465 [Dreissena polymorpha]|uniref:Uncharacterized protein n=1 Tax=Dreissena polymorpha TaxID=45954 RepID=A0A9D3YQN3_DREPO|nr:hypothetical protein DPMN_077465 [Dreissena polymorpha]